MFLIERDGEQQVVASLAGYEGWQVLERGVARPRGHCDRGEVGGRRCWLPARDRNAASDEVAALRDRIERLEARLAAIDAPQ
jgi:hypothetical protein